MPNAHFGKILGRLSTSCTFPCQGQLEDDICHICLRDSLKPCGDEVPTKLGCGHVFGLSCLLNWASGSLAEGRTSPNCPICRTPFLTEALCLQTPQQIETESLSRVFLNVDLPLVGHPRLSEDEEEWIGDAERLWVDFCGQLVDSLLDLHLTGLAYFQDAPAAVSRFELCQTLAETFLSYEKVYNFYQAYSNPSPEFEQNIRLLRWWENLHVECGLTVPNAYGSLIAHLDTADAGLMRNWRISRAFRDTPDEESDTDEDETDTEDNQTDTEDTQTGTQDNQMNTEDSQTDTEHYRMNLAARAQEMRAYYRPIEWAPQADQSAAGYV
ncbi:MAG: hypothetical protein Q9207_003596 [Kuettlingeria erythrocarpa]